MLWEAIFLLLILKIPIVYMCLVVWWAIRAEPSDELPVTAAVVTDTPSPLLPPEPPVPVRPRSPHGPRRKDDGRGRRERVARRPVAARGETRP